MIAKSVTIDISDMPDVLRLVEQAHADDVTILLERDGRPLAELSRRIASASELTPERRRGILERMVGAWRDVDTDAFIEDIYRRREAVSRAPVVLNEPSS